MGSIHLKVLWVLLSLLVLPGCYESSSDLIGNRAVEIKRFDSVLVINGSAYYMMPKGNYAVACSLQTRQDALKPCKNGQQVKFERTPYGNYIVQYSDVGNRFKYGLWLRGERADISKRHACVYWLGDGIVGDNPITNYNTLKETYGNMPFFQRLSQDVRGVSTEPLIDRKQLLEIASIYERAFYTLTGEDSYCIQSRVGYSHEHVVLSKDNRHVKELE